MGCTIVKESEIAAVEDFGKFSRILTSGFHCINPCTESVAHTASLQIQAINIEIETITKEQLSVKIKIGIQYKIMQSDTELPYDSNCIELETEPKGKAHRTYGVYQKSTSTSTPLVAPDNTSTNNPIYRAIYTTANPKLQMMQHIEAYFREISCSLLMYDMFLSKSKLSDELVKRLNYEMSKYGYVILHALIGDIDPPQNIKDTMNNVHASANKRDAMKNEAEAKKNASILEAQGLAEVRRLEGVGLAEQRKAIVEGLKSSISDFGGDPAKLDTQELTHTIIMMQYIEMLNRAAQSGHNTFILPTTMHTLEDQIRTAMLSSKPTNP